MNFNGGSNSLTSNSTIVSNLNRNINEDIAEAKLNSFFYGAGSIFPIALTGTLEYALLNAIAKDPRYMSLLLLNIPLLPLSAFATKETSTSLLNELKRLRNLITLKLYMSDEKDNSKEAPHLLSRYNNINKNFR